MARPRTFQLRALGALAGLVWLWAAHPVSQDRTARIVVGPEVLISRNEDFAHVETMLATKADDARQLLASSIVRPKDSTGRVRSGTRTYASRDAGKTWDARPLPDENQWDPIVAFTPRGAAVFVCLIPPKLLSVFRSDGDAWKDRIDLPFLDGPMIAVDWTAGKHHGQIYISGRQGEDENPFVIYRSADDARSFETAVVIETPSARRAFNPLVLRDGSVFVPFSTVGRSSQQIDSVRSVDGGRSFSQLRAVATRQPNPTDTGDTPPAVFAAGEYRNGERVYVVYPVYQGSANARLVLSYSDTAGDTWSPAREVAPDAADDLSQSAANVSVNRSGIVGVSWLARRNETYDLFFTASFDGGDHFLPPARISSQSSRPGPVDRFFPGEDYMLTAAAPDGTFHLLWPDARSGVSQLYTAAVRIE